MQRPEQQGPTTNPAVRTFALLPSRPWYATRLGFGSTPPVATLVNPLPQQNGTRRRRHAGDCATPWHARVTGAGVSARDHAPKLEVCWCHTLGPCGATRCALISAQRCAHASWARMVQQSPVQAPRLALSHC
eukprot:358848-Chlamydomonas_euryale.AAC.12